MSNEYWCHLYIKVFPDRAVRKLILALECSCAHQEYGCPWQGKLADWEVSGKTCYTSHLGAGICAGAYRSWE